MQITRKKRLGFLKHESIKQVIPVPGMPWRGLIQAAVEQRALRELMDPV